MAEQTEGPDAGGAGVDRSITVGRDANNCVITSGNGNTVIVYQAVAAVAMPLAGASNPYRGLLAFTEADADRFFGREEQVTNLWERFRDLIGASKATRLLAILGPSGSGKSSLARAGLVPELARRPVSARQLRVATMTPGRQPLQALALLLARVVTNDPVEAVSKKVELLALLQPAGGQASTGLRRIAESLCADGQPLVLLIDQFEEIYSLCQDEAERKTFLGNLLDAASDPAGCLSVIITLRSDFLGATQADSGLNQIIASQNVIVPAMSPEELRLAIAQPAIRAGYPIDENTIQRLIAETEGRDGALPLLQFVLVRIWEGMVKRVTAAKTVADLGGVGGALGAEAERIYGKLNGGDQIIAQRAFLAMVKFNENKLPTRHTVFLSQLVRDDDGPDQAQALHRVHGVVGAFAQWDTRLVTMAATPNGDQTVEVSHEAIFEHWDQLKKWLEDRMDDIRLHLRVTEAATEWDRQGRPEGSLWRPPDLDLLRALAEKPTTSLSNIEKAFFQASDQTLKSGRAAARRLQLAVTLIIVAALTAFAAWITQVNTVIDATVYLERNRIYAPAEHLLDLALWMHPLDRQIILKRAEIYVRLGKDALAAGDYDYLRGEYAGSSEELNTLCWSQATYNFRLSEGALKDCDAALMASDVLDSRAFLLFRLGRLQEALDVYKAALAKRPPQGADRAITLYGKGRTELKLHQIEAGLRDINEAKKLAAMSKNPDDRDVEHKFSGYRGMQ